MHWPSMYVCMYEAAAKKNKKIGNTQHAKGEQKPISSITYVYIYTLGGWHQSPSHHITIVDQRGQTMEVLRRLTWNRAGFELTRYSSQSGSGRPPNFLNSRLFGGRVGVRGFVLHLFDPFCLYIYHIILYYHPPNLSPYRVLY